MEHICSCWVAMHATGCTAAAISTPTKDQLGLLLQYLLQQEQEYIACCDQEAGDVAWIHTPHVLEPHNAAGAHPRHVPSILTPARYMITLIIALSLNSPFRAWLHMNIKQLQYGFSPGTAPRYTTMGAYLPECVQPKIPCLLSPTIVCSSTARAVSINTPAAMAVTGAL